MKLTMLGTGHAVVYKCYNTCFVLEDGGRCFLVDGGGGSTLLVQLKNAGISPTDIHDIFVTHRHMDHIMGIFWMMRMLYRSKTLSDNGLNIYGHDEVISIIRDMTIRLLPESEACFSDGRIRLIAVNDGESKEILGRKVTFFDIQSTKAKQFGFCMESADGDKLTCCGDEPYTECERKYAEGSKWLMHEAFCLHAEADKYHPYEKHHSTVMDACRNAEELNVRNLILYHTEDEHISERKKLYTGEGKKYFNGNLFVPDDLEVIEL